MSKRLESTKNIFNNKSATTVALVRRADLQAKYGYRTLNHLRGSLVRASRPRKIAQISAKVSDAAVSLGLNPTTIQNRTKLLAKINWYKKQNSHLQYASYQQAFISLCANYEDLVGRVIEKYFEEDAERLSKYKLSVSSKFIIDAVRRGDNLHHTLSTKLSADLMAGGVKEWHRQLEKIGINLGKVPHELHEVFLIRNCIVHNDKKVSTQLHAKNPKKYPLRSSLRLTTNDVIAARDVLHWSMKQIVSEYNLLYPTQKGTWLNPVPKNLAGINENKTS